MHHAITVFAFSNPTVLAYTRLARRGSDLTEHPDPPTSHCPRHPHPDVHVNYSALPTYNML